MIRIRHKLCVCLAALCASSANAGHAYAQQEYGYRPPSIQLDLNVLNEIDPPPILKEPDRERYKVPGFEHLRPDPVERIILQAPPEMTNTATDEEKEDNPLLPIPAENVEPPFAAIPVIDINPSLPASIAVPPTPDKKPEDNKKTALPSVKYTHSAATSLEDIARNLDVVKPPPPIGSENDEPVIGNAKTHPEDKSLQQAINIDLPLQEHEKPSPALMIKDPLADVPEQANIIRKKNQIKHRPVTEKQYKDIAKDPLLARLSNPNAEEILDSIDPKGPKTRTGAKKTQKAAKTSMAVSSPRDNMIRLLFAHGQSEIDYTDLQGFLLLAEEKMEVYPGARIEIQAYASALNENQSSAHRLSLARALGIRDLLVTGNINARLIDLRPMGMDETQKDSDRADIYFITSTQ